MVILMQLVSCETYDDIFKDDDECKYGSGDGFIVLFVNNEEITIKYDYGDYPIETLGACDTGGIGLRILFRTDDENEDIFRSTFPVVINYLVAGQHTIDVAYYYSNDKITYFGEVDIYINEPIGDNNYSRVTGTIIEGSYILTDSNVQSTITISGGRFEGDVGFWDKCDCD